MTLKHNKFFELFIALNGNVVGCMISVLLSQLKNINILEQPPSGIDPQGDPAMAAKRLRGPRGSWFFFFFFFFWGGWPRPHCFAKLCRSTRYRTLFSTFAYQQIVTSFSIVWHRSTFCSSHWRWPSGYGKMCFPILSSGIIYVLQLLIRRHFYHCSSVPCFIYGFVVAFGSFLMKIINFNTHTHIYTHKMTFL